MITGSCCFTEILMSVKPCSSNSEHSHSADSASASGVARPYLASSRLSSEPALTPILIGTPASPAAAAMSATLSSNALMLPGFTRTAPQPASIAANTYLGWKWMSAITGIWDLRAISGSASASSCDGTATRTIWQPVVVIDWTDTGAPPPTGTACLPLPTMIWRDLRRGASGSGGSCGRPRSTVIEMIASLHEMNRIEDVRRDEKQPEPDEQREYPDADRDELPHVHQPGIGPAAQPGQPRPRPLVDHHGEMAAVQREQREQVEGADEDVQRDDDQQDVRDLDLPAVLRRDHLGGDSPDAHDAGHLASGRVRPVLGEQVGDRGRQVPDGTDRADQDLAERRARVGDRTQRAEPLEGRRVADPEVGPGAAGDADRDGMQHEPPAGPQHGDGHRLALGLRPDGRAELGPVAHLPAADGNDLVVVPDPRGPGRGDARVVLARSVVEGGQGGRDARADRADLRRVVIRQPDPERQHDQQEEGRSEER